VAGTQEAMAVFGDGVREQRAWPRRRRTTGARRWLDRGGGGPEAPLMSPRAQICRERENWIWRGCGRACVLSKSPYFCWPEPADGSYHSNFHRPTTGRWMLR
jgi:hypothetical protein